MEVIFLVLNRPAASDLGSIIELITGSESRGNCWAVYYNDSTARWELDFEAGLNSWMQKIVAQRIYTW